MEYINEININESIIHILDSAGTEPVLNEFKLDLDENTYKFIYKHIEKCLNSEDLKYAKFNSGRSIVKELVSDYLAGINDDIINLSKELANQLFSIIKSTDAIPSCDLIIASIATDQGPMIAILKMDYIKNFTHEINFIEKKIGIDLTTQIAGLPGSGQKIQTAAFIKPFREEASYNLMVLDKQNIHKVEDYDANYFTERFLRCSVVTNERDMTKALLDTTEAWTRKNFPNNAVKAEEIRNTVQTKLKEEESINISELSEKLLKDVPELKDDFEEVLISNDLTKDIPVDKQWVDKNLKKRKIRLQNGTSLIVTDDIYNDPNQFKIENNNDGSINIILKNITAYIEKNK